MASLPRRLQAKADRCSPSPARSRRSPSAPTARSWEVRPSMRPRRRLRAPARRRHARRLRQRRRPRKAATPKAVARVVTTPKPPAGNRGGGQPNRPAAEARRGETRAPPQARPRPATTRADGDATPATTRAQLGRRVLGSTCRARQRGGGAHPAPRGSARNSPANWRRARDRSEGGRQGRLSRPHGRHVARGCGLRLREDQGCRRRLLRRQELSGTPVSTHAARLRLGLLRGLSR